jgi:protein O-mannosyl-transferase
VRTVAALIKPNLVMITALVITFIVYARLLWYPHISWDDPEMVFRNNDVQVFNLKAFFTDHYVGNYLPLTMLAHGFAWLLFKSWDGGHHLINLLLHLVNGILVMKAGERLLRTREAGIAGAVIFLLHPLQTESVVWISELKNVLSTTFYLLALLRYISFTERKKQSDYLFCFLFFIFGCLCRPSVVVLPLALICVDVIVDQRITWKYILYKLPMLAVSVLFGVLNMKAQTEDQFINHAHEFPYWQRLGFAGYAILQYLRLFLLPFRLSVIYNYPEAKSVVFIAGCIFIALLIFLLIYLARRKKFTHFSLIAFILVNLALVLQFVPFGEVLYADRYMYVPVIGFAWLLTTVLPLSETWVKGLLALLILYLTVIMSVRISKWKNAITLYEDIIQKYPAQFIALNSAGVECMFMNEDDKALAYFNRATQAAPRNYKGFYNRGLLYLKQQRPRPAVKSFSQSLALYDYAKAYAGRATAYYMLAENDKAQADAERAIAIEPSNAKAHFVLGNCFNDGNLLDKAILEYDLCISLNGEEPGYYFKRAIAYGKKQRFDLCIEDLNKCLGLDPAFYEAYYWRGVAKVNLKQDPCPDLLVAARQNYEPAVQAFKKFCK